MIAGAIQRITSIARRPGVLVAAWALALGVLAVAGWRVLLPALGYRSLAFPSYYTSARLALSGNFGPAIYDEVWFGNLQTALGLRADIFGPQPPTMALLMLPVAWMPPAPARVAWIGLALACLLAIGLLMWRAAQTRPGDRLALPLILLLLAAYRPLHAELRYAQVYTLLALCYALWLYGYARGRDGLAGAALAALALAKLAGWPLWLLLIVERRWRALGWAVGLGAAVVLLSLPLLGRDVWVAYLTGELAGVTVEPIFAVTAFQTLAGLLRQLFVYNADFTPAPLLDAPLLAAGLWWLAAAALLLPTLLRRGRSRLLTGAAMLCLVVPIQPAGEQHHYLVLLAPLLLAILLRAELAASPAALLLALAAAALLVLPPNYFLDNAAWAGWPRAPLAYPRLYAALLLWGAMLLWRSRPPAPAPAADGGQGAGVAALAPAPAAADGGQGAGSAAPALATPLAPGEGGER